MEPFTVYKWIRGRVPEWYVRRCFDAILKINGDRFRGHAPFTLVLADWLLEQRLDCGVVEFTFVPITPLEAVAVRPDGSVMSIGQVLTTEMFERLDLRSLGLT